MPNPEAPIWRRWRWVRPPTPGRDKSASSVATILADIRRMLMDPSTDAQTIITQVNALPDAIAKQVASEVTTAEAARDAQHAADLAAIGAAVTAVTNSVTPPAAA